MATARPYATNTIEDYVRFEEHSNSKHEFYRGQIIAMAGGTPEHGLYATNIARILGDQLVGRPCRVQSSDVRIRVNAHLDTYPDVSIVCDAAVRDRDDKNAIINPVLLVEVLSPSTEAYDRGEKLEHYKTMSSLREVVLVAHDTRRIDLVTRQDDGSWRTTSAAAGETVALALGIELPVDAVYHDPLAPAPM